MARKNRLTRYISAVWDRDAAKRLEQEAEASLERAGKESAAALEGELAKGGQKGARALTRALQAEYKIRMARAQQQLADGAIDEKRFRKEGEKAAQEFNRGLSDGINKLRASGGGLTDAQYAGLAGRYKRTGGGGMGALAMAGRFAGPLAAVFSVGALVRESGEATSAADRLEAAVRKLGGTARLTGIDLGFLQETAADAKEEFRLSTPVANEFTSEVVKLTEKAGALDRTGDALRSLLDLGAARGLSAAQSLTAISQAILGIDEGTDKLFGKNPSVLYAEYAQRIGTTAGKLTDQQKAQALLDATLRAGEQVRGQYAEYLTSSAGKAEQAATRIEEMQAQAGKAIQPFRELANELKVGLYTVLGGIAERLNRIRENPVWDEMAERRSRRTRFFEDLFGLRQTTNLGASRSWTPNAPAGGGGLSAPEQPTRTEPTEAEKKAAEARVKALWAHLEKWTHSQQAYDAVTRMAFAPGSTDIRQTATTGPGANPAAVAAFAAESQFKDMMKRMEGHAERAAFEMSDAFQDAFALMLESGITFQNFFEGMGRSIAGIAGRIVAEFAAGKAKEHFAAAIGAAAYALGFTSHGNFASASAAWSSAGQHTAAGLAFSALAGGAAAGGQAVRSRAPGSTYDAGLSTAQRAEREPGRIEIWIDTFSENNPSHVRKVGRAMDLNVHLTGRPDWARGSR